MDLDTYLRVLRRTVHGSEVSRRDVAEGARAILEAGCAAELDDVHGVEGELVLLLRVGEDKAALARAETRRRKLLRVGACSK
jgi:hypothetical protein